MHIRELIQILREAKTAEDIDRYRDEIMELIPKTAIMIGFDQKNYAHQYDLWLHSLHTVIGLPKEIDDDMLFLAALIHDIGKPDCQTEGEKDGRVNMHYYGHPARSMEITRDEIIPGLLSKGESLSKEEISFRVKYCELMEYYQYLEMRLKFICAALLADEEK